MNKWDETRCRTCGLKLVANAAEGCTEGNCSMRPAPKVRADEGYGPGTHECGKAFCEACGDCLACYGDDICPENGGGKHVRAAAA